MPDPVIHVGRNGAPLGTFAPDEVRELLDSGFLKPSDSSWTRGMKEWRPLNETLSRLSAHPDAPDWRDSVVAGSTALSRLIGRRMGTFVASVKSQASGGQGGISQTTKTALEHYLPHLKKLLADKLRDKPAAFARDALRNEETLRSVSAGLYLCLPRPLRRFVPETAFVNFCLEHRQKLFSSTAPSSDAPSPDATAHSPSSSAKSPTSDPPPP